MLEKMLIKKMAVTGNKLRISAALCGMILSVISVFAFMMMNISDNAILNKVLYSASFTVVLLMIILNNYDLFTGNTMALTLIKSKKLSAKVVVNNLVNVYLFNFVGCILTVLLLDYLHVFEKSYISDYLATVFTTKTSYDVIKLLVLGIGANFFVCMAVHRAGEGEKTAEKYFKLFFPIFIFCLLGFEHSIANMFSLTYSAVNDLSLIPLLFYNLFFVTIGNIIGGMLYAYSARVKG